MVVAFSSNLEGPMAGVELTEQFNDWIEVADENSQRVIVESIHTSSSTKGWLMVVKYQILSNNMIIKKTR
jgi:hypothetical protein